MAWQNHITLNNALQRLRERKIQQAAAIVWRRTQSCLAEKHSKGLSNTTDGAKKPSAKKSMTAKQPKCRGPGYSFSTGGLIEYSFMRGLCACVLYLIKIAMRRKLTLKCLGGTEKRDWIQLPHARRLEFSIKTTHFLQKLP